jgi:toxin YoeB
MKRVILEDLAQNHIHEHFISEPKLVKKIFDLISTIQKNPFDGIGKPEALKHDYQGYWSRRINEKHRLLYEITDEEIIIIRCKGHYDDK